MPCTPWRHAELRGVQPVLGMAGWQPAHLTQMCILAGCDYLKSLNGMGIKKAFNAIAAVNIHSMPPDECYQHVIRHLSLQVFRAVLREK